MAKEKYKYLPIEEETSEISIREVLDKYLRYWPWFLILTSLMLGMAFLYLKLAPKTFKTISSIIINDEKNGANSDASGYMDVGVFSGLKTNSIANELGLLMSKRLMLNAAKALDLNVQYLDDSGFLVTELYDQSPIKIQLLRFDEKALNRSINAKQNTFRIRKKGEDGFEFINETTQASELTSYATPISLAFADFVVQPNEDADAYATKWESVLVTFVSLSSVAEGYAKKLNVEVLEEKSTLIELSLEDRVKKKAEDILNQLVYEYNREAIEDKNLIAKNTADFIDERLQIINKELDSVESGKENFKEQNRLTDIGAESSMLIQNVSQYNKEQSQLQNQLELTSSMLNYVDSEKFNLFPSNLGLEETSVNQIIEQYNDLVLERNKLVSSSTENNPVVLNLTEQISQLKNSLKYNLENTRNNLMISEDNLRKKSGALGFQMSQIPGQERQVRGIERQQGIKEALYLYLLQKREENTLALSVTAPKAKLVDPAYSTGGSISPSPKVVLGVAFLLGLLLPISVIRGKELLNNKIQKKADIEMVIKDIPIIGELPRIGKKEHEFILKNDRSMLAESFRILSANLQYTTIHKPDQKGGKKIFITSTIKGEGKTFVAINLAITLALSGKKVILLGCDLRNPQLHRYDKGLKNVLGISDYLINKEQNLSHLYQDTILHESLKVLPSGSIPPNPAELFQLERMGTLFEELQKEFDYIVVDTAPAMLLADTFLINKYAEVTLCVIRSGVTNHNSLEFIKDTQKNGKLKNLNLVLNDLKLNNFAYGNNYGYTYGA